MVSIYLAADKIEDSGWIPLIPLLVLREKYDVSTDTFLMYFVKTTNCVWNRAT